MTSLRVLVAMALTSLLALQVKGASFQGLGFLPGGVSSRADDISADGSVVTGMSVQRENSSQAFRWTSATGMVGLGAHSRGIGISADGSVIVGERATEFSQLEPFRWSSSTGMEALSDVPSSGWGSAWATSHDGEVVVGFADFPPGRAFRWTRDEGMEMLGTFPGAKPGGYAFDVSSDGSVVVGQAPYAAGTQAFRWTEGSGMQGLGDLPGGGVNSTAQAVSLNGKFIVGGALSAIGREAFLWTSDTGLVGLGRIGNRSTGALDVSANGEIIVGYHDAGNLASQGAMIWDATHGARDLRTVLVNDYRLNMEGWALGSAEAVSANGRTIVGWGFHAGRRDPEAWIAAIPEPSSVVLSALGAAVLFIFAPRAFRRPTQVA